MGMMRRLAMAAGLVAATALANTPAAAQATVGADVALYSHYVWRGLTFTNKLPAIQPDVWLSYSGFTVGAWANVEPSKCDGADDLCESGYGRNLDGVGFAPRSGIAEIDLWVDYARTSGNVSWKLGWIIYTFNEDNGVFTNAFDTHEVYGSASIGNLPVTPALYASYDIGKVKGLYLEPSVSYPWAAGPGVTVNLKALAGISAGQEINTDPASDDNFNFFESGLTHVDLSASASFAAGPISFTPAVHFQISNDEFTRLNDAGDAADFFATLKKGPSTKFWGGVIISWSRALGGS